MIGLDDIAAGADIDTLSRNQVAGLLHRLAAAQTRLAVVLTEANDDRPAEDRLLDVNEAAARLGETVEWVYRRTKTLPFARRQGRHVRFSSREIDKYIRERR
jgi:excisionase family DNA binding protein